MAIFILIITYFKNISVSRGASSSKEQRIQIHTKIRAEKKCYLFKKCQIVYVFASFWRLFVELSQMITMFVIV